MLGLLGRHCPRGVQCADGRILHAHRGSGVFFHGRNEAIAVAIDGLDQPLHASAVANGQAHGPDCTFQGGIADDLLGPHLLAHFLLEHRTGPVLEQIKQRLKHLWPQPDAPASTPQGMLLEIKGTLAKTEDHRTTLLLPPLHLAPQQTR
jgi:hypothetical protein